MTVEVAFIEITYLLVYGLAVSAVFIIALLIIICWFLNRQ